LKTSILFDLGKVLLDFDKEIILDGFRRATNLSEDEIQEGLWLYVHLGFETGNISSQEFYERVRDTLSLKMSFDEFRNVWCNIFREVPEMVDLFHRLRKEYKTYILSNTDSLHMPYVLEKFPWLNLFDGQALSYKLGERKPSPEFFKRALDKFKLDPAECVFIDDIEENVLAGRAAGIDSIQHITPKETISELRKLGIETGGPA